MKLIDIAHGRSGDKGDAANVGIIAYDDKGFEIITKYLTAEQVKKHFTGICFGGVERYELPNLKALNFILHNTLGGGGTVSLKLDAQGKTLAAALLRMEIEIENNSNTFLNKNMDTKL
ncbi:MAG: hypothetical protein GW805_09465 [Ignavibacteria bacterium]|nr:hypothetical protein [Ignavibacteria bacterium]OIO15256.1 MAG: hypothetical protein AUJ54_13020 [Ignavibacteria bacterium CG1_02_37_35]